MKIRQFLILLLTISTTLLVACGSSDERATATPQIHPPADTPAPEVDPTITAYSLPPVTDLPGPTVTTESAEASAIPTETVSLPEATVTIEPEPPGTRATLDAAATVQPPTSTNSDGSSLISYFRSDVEETDPGKPITLQWSTTNALTVTLWHLAPTGQFGSFWPVADSGSFDYQVADHEHNRTTFALSAIDEQGNNEMATVEVTLRCLDIWFFSEAPDICPAATAVFSAGAEQQFERGTMIWIAAENRIYVLFDDGQQYAWQAYTDDWSQGKPENDPELLPPSGMHQPVRGFGLVWREQPEVMERLGWAVTEERAYDTDVQRTSFPKYNETYIRALDGLLWHLLAERSDWTKVRAGSDS